MQKVCIIIAIL